MAKIATDPPVSRQQQKAMCAAAHGNSNLGISKSVGEEFCGKVKSDKDIAKDMKKSEWRDLVEKLNKFLEEEEEEDEHAEDKKDCEEWEDFGNKHYCNHANDSWAFDQTSVRSYDADGRLHVDQTNISKANICPYLGSEIPNYQALGLDSEKIYRLYRDPSELIKGADTFNNLPLLSTHVPVSADAHKPELVIGSTGTDAAFDGIYLKNSLVIWAKDEIDKVEDSAKRELSCAYRYTADMTPGTVNGEAYDGRMTNIIGNHVSLVSTGRAGPDVCVADSREGFGNKEGIIIMSNTALTRKAAAVQGAVYAFLRPLLAQDSKVDLGVIFEGVSAGNLKDEGPFIFGEVRKATRGKLAKDARLDGLPELLMAMDAECDVKEKEEKAEDEWPDDDEEEKKEKKASDKKSKKAMDEDDEEDTDKKSKKAMDEPPPFEGKPEKKGAEDMVSKAVMDAAITAAVELAQDKAAKMQAEIRAAERAIRPYVGELSMSFDSADEVYRAALEAKGVDTKDIHASAFRAMLKLVPINAPRAIPAMAHDASGVIDFDKEFPMAGRIKIS